MGVDELLKRHEQLEALLRNVGPASFLRALRGACRPGELRAHDTHTLDGGWRATRFLYADPQGCLAVISIYNRPGAAGAALVLKLERMAQAA